MTNVPENIREMWKDVYVLFDTHYNINADSQEEWNAFWAEAIKINEKHMDIPCVIDLLDTVSEMIAKFSVKRNGRRELNGDRKKLPV